MATFWTADQRAEIGREEILRLYHLALTRHGVTGYTWDDLLADYRLALLDWSLVPLQDRADGSTRDYWWPKMRNLLATCRDHDAASLLAE